MRTELDLRVHHDVHALRLVTEGRTVTQGGMNLLRVPPETLGTNVGVRCGRRAVLARKHVPLATTAQDMKGAIENHSQIDDPESSIRLGEWKQVPKDSPLTPSRRTGGPSDPLNPIASPAASRGLLPVLDPLSTALAWIIHGVATIGESAVRQRGRTAVPRHIPLGAQAAKTPSDSSI